MKQLKIAINYKENGKNTIFYPMLSQSIPYAFTKYIKYAFTKYTPMLSQSTNKNI